MSKLFALIVISLLGSMHATAQTTTQTTTLPTAEDSPWFETSKALDGITDPEQIESVIEAHIPGFMKQIKQDAKATGLLNLWGLSRNIDESNLATGLKTVPENLLRYFVQLWEVPYNSTFTEGHAGLTHTYGYLFSNMSTPYGFKRARYVRGELEEGFGLPDGTFSGRSKTGTLFSNLTCFIGQIAFRDNPEVKDELLEAMEGPSVQKVKELVEYPYPSLEPRRLVETVQNEKYRLEIRTDIVNFPYPVTRGKDTALLIYSIDFRTPKQPPRPRLITAFPVDEKSAKGVFDAPAVPIGTASDQIPVKLKYNAVLPVSIPAEELKGKRTIIEERN